MSTSRASGLRVIRAEQPLPIPRQQHHAGLYQWWKLPSGQVVELRRITGQRNPEVIVRNINQDGEMAPGEYSLTLRFLVNHAQKVKG